MEKYIQNIQEFADKWDLTFEQEGQVGFGRDCVGLIRGTNYINYNPINMNTYDDLEEFYDERLNDICPEDAYHKHNCLAVLGRGEEAIKQLSEWVDKLKELNVKIVEYSTGIQAMVSGAFGYTVKIKK